MLWPRFRPSVLLLNRRCFHKRSRYSTGSFHPRVCIIGSGPGGFYVAQHLLKGCPNLHVDLVERLPVPFGLVRYGVAPDHPEVKNVDSTFTKTAQSPRFRFFGNVHVGKDISFQELRSAYPVLVLAYGAGQSRSLGIIGENLSNVISAKNFVGFYNGFPDDQDLDIDFSTHDTAVVVGVGNVAFDVARILISPIDHLKKTDITELALHKLSQSRIRRVFIVGRRGPLHVSFTIKELREMLQIPGVQPIFHEKEQYREISHVISSLKRPQKRLTELLVKSALQEEPSEKQMKYWNRNSSKSWHLKLLRTPFKIHGVNEVTGITFSVNRLVGNSPSRSQVEMTDEKEYFDCGLILSSVGYRSLAPPSESKIPFDTEEGIIPNVNGKVEDGLYVAGWLGTGPRGVIVDTMTSSFRVANTILEDITGRQFNETVDLAHVLKAKNVNYVTWKDWERIDRAERKNPTKSRQKITNVKRMLEILQR